MGRLPGGVWIVYGSVNVMRAVYDSMGPPRRGDPGPHERLAGLGLGDAWMRSVLWSNDARGLGLAGR